jgi:hypothetical protein
MRLTDGREMVSSELMLYAVNAVILAVVLCHPLDADGQAVYCWKV